MINPSTLFPLLNPSETPSSLFSPTLSFPLPFSFQSLWSLCFQSKSDSNTTRILLFSARSCSCGSNLATGELVFSLCDNSGRIEMGFRSTEEKCVFVKGKEMGSSVDDADLRRCDGTVDGFWFHVFSLCGCGKR